MRNCHMMLISKQLLCLDERRKHKWQESGLLYGALLRLLRHIFETLSKAMFKVFWDRLRPFFLSEGLILARKALFSLALESWSPGGKNVCCFLDFRVFFLFFL